MSTRLQQKPRARNEPQPNQTRLNSSWVSPPFRTVGFRTVFTTLTLIFLSSALAAASEPEIKVTGCVVDIRGNPYRQVEIKLHGLNYKGGAHYTGNNSIGTTNERGEFTVRMKAGSPAQPARAKIHGKYAIYVTKGWSGGGAWGGTDVWPEMIVENIGQPVDLRQKACIAFPYPIDVMGTITSDELYDEQDTFSNRTSLILRLSEGDDYTDTAAIIPSDPRTVRNINFGVDLRPGHKYRIDIFKQPYSSNSKKKICFECNVTAGKNGAVGDSDDNLSLLPNSSNYNYWAVNKLRLHCTTRRTVKPEADCQSADAKDEVDRTEDTDSAALSREGANSGSTMFQKAVEEAEQEEKNRPARQARERAAQALAAEQEQLEKQRAIAAARAAEPEQAREDERKSRETGEALGQLLGAIGQYQQNKADSEQAAYEEQQRLLKTQQDWQRGQSAYGGGGEKCCSCLGKTRPKIDCDFGWYMDHCGTKHCVSRGEKITKEIRERCPCSAGK